MKEKFDWSTAKMIWQDSNGNGIICRVYRDARGNGLVRHEADPRVVERQAKVTTELRRSYWSDKSTSFFNSRVRDGDRIIGSIPTWASIEFPHIYEDQKEMLLFFDKYPQFKRNPAKWTKTTPGKKLIGGIKDDKRIIVG